MTTFSEVAADHLGRVRGGVGDGGQLVQGSDGPPENVQVGDLLVERVKVGGENVLDVQAQGVARIADVESLRLVASLFRNQLPTSCCA